MEGKENSEEFDGGLYPELENFGEALVRRFLAKNGFAAKLSKRMSAETSTKFIDWIDHVVLPESDVSYDFLSYTGLKEDSAQARPDGARVFRHPRSYLFPILVGKNKETEISLKPEELDRFVQALGIAVALDGGAFAPLRRAVISRQGDHVLSAVERRGCSGFAAKAAGDAKEYVEALNGFLHRERSFDVEQEGLDCVEQLVDSALKVMGSERVCDAFLRSERVFWQSRNKAGRTQKARQDLLGLGWGNHDHHAFRSSRENFARMLALFGKMGLSFRERYYAGEQAGWGAQVLENMACGVVVFADVDLRPEESGTDFSQAGLEHGRELGTVGLWVGLHGESLLQAGMHHLAARFDFEKLGGDLKKSGLKLMAPFSKFEFLKQAFTAGEEWKADGARLDRLLGDSSITQAQHKKFKSEGAIGSHLEDLERGQGFKGFNNSPVTKIVKGTDPGAQAVGA